jgi:hypothetical protein
MRRVQTCSRRPVRKTHAKTPEREPAVVDAPEHRVRRQRLSSPGSESDDESADFCGEPLPDGVAQELWSEAECMSITHFHFGFKC